MLGGGRIGGRTATQGGWAGVLALTCTGRLERAGDPLAWGCGDLLLLLRAPMSSDLVALTDTLTLLSLLTLSPSDCWDWRGGGAKLGLGGRACMLTFLNSVARLAMADFEGRLGASAAFSLRRLDLRGSIFISGAGGGVSGLGIREVGGKDGLGGLVLGDGSRITGWVGRGGDLGWAGRGEGVRACRIFSSWTPTNPT